MRTVLIAESHSDNRMSYLKYFTKKGFQVATASDGLECVEKLLPVRPSLLILDLELSWGGGDGVLAVMREESKMIAIPVILTSSSRPAHQLVEMVKAPVLKALAKPFALESILSGTPLASIRTSRDARFIRERGVLVVDDEVSIRILLKEYLQLQGYRVWTACNGEEALDICCDDGDQIDMVLLDVLMPKLDGPQTLEGIRETFPELPVCFMTGDSGKYRHNDLLDFGASYVIHKPFRLDEISRLVRQLSRIHADEMQPV